MNQLLTHPRKPGGVCLLFQGGTLRSVCRVFLGLFLALIAPAAVAEKLKPAEADTTSRAKWRSSNKIEASSFPREPAFSGGLLLPDFRFAEIPAGPDYTLFPLVLGQPDHGSQKEAPAGSLALEEPLGSQGQGPRYFGALLGKSGFRTSGGAEDRLSRLSWPDKFRTIRTSRAARPRFFFESGGDLLRSTGSGAYPDTDYAGQGAGQPWISANPSFSRAIVRYGINAAVALRLDFERDVRLYQLSDDPFRVRNGFVRTDDLTPGLHLEYTAPGGWTLASGLRWYADPSFAIFDENDEQPFLSDVRSGWSALVRISFDF